MFKTVLVANRGEIAGRIIATLRRLNIASVAVYSDTDRFTLPVLAADRAIALRGATVAETYLNVDAIVAACRASGAEAVHPGYGFLSENAVFAKRLADAGIAFVGPRREHLETFGLKHTARALAERAGVPLLPGSGVLDDLESALDHAAAIGYPVILKSTAGGGGIGMQVCRSADDLGGKYATVRRLAAANFGDERIFLEKYVERARHIEVQIFGDGGGRVVALGERDCSLQRRHQKVIEETPAPGLDDDVRSRLHAAAVALGETVRYASAGTVEFIYDASTKEFFFLEVNTRLQVEHGVTELVYGIDLVEWMLRQAAGEFAFPAHSALAASGAAIEARIYAEDPARGFRPSVGLLTRVRFPHNARVDTWVETGTAVSANYDPLLAKILVHDETRTGALARMADALRETSISGIETNLGYVSAVIDDQRFASGEMTTGTLAAFAYSPDTVEVLKPGVRSSLQELPGRLGFWHVGVPPSGPMDERSFRFVNRVLGNPEETCALELTLHGPTLRFHAPVIVALGGAKMQADIDGVPVAYGTPTPAPTGAVLTIGAIVGPGARTYLGVRGGFDSPLYLGSRATFALGGFGGHATGTLKTGDVLRIAPAGTNAAAVPPDVALDAAHLTASWEIGVVYGPHGSPDFFTDADVATLFEAEYEVHFNSDRTGVRLIGPKPAWARRDGGEAGLHPSNIHDNAYAVGSIDFTGDMPIILGPDGPSLGGFVCPAVVARTELWKVGQLRPGNRVRFRRAPVTSVREQRVAHAPPASAVYAQLDDREVAVVYRIAGDENVLVEYGPMVLDIALRLRVHLLMTALETARVPGIIDLTPGIRSLQVHYDSSVLTLAEIVELLMRLEDGLPSVDDVDIPSRIIHLPLSWNDDAATLAMRKYQELVRPNAPWCPSNIEFIRRINGLDSIEDVKRIVFDARYLVLGLGDVYLGAPVATPLDPRHRLITTKYNPARTWTPENAVGIGGAYLCIYGMEGPGGYQLVGRTIQVWNSWRSTEVFEPGSPWLLRFFDQIRFFPVTGEELLEARAAFPHGRYPVRIEHERFRFHEYREFLASNAADIEAFQQRRQAAFDVERHDWAARGLDTYVPEDGLTPADVEDALPPGVHAVESPVPGNVWKVLVQAGHTVDRGDPLVILESMKMELEVCAPHRAVVQAVRCASGKPVNAGQTLVLLSAEAAA
jgi:urea carboxylase